jgi:hypothetical protein
MSRSFVQYWLYVSDIVTGDWGRGFPGNPFGDPDAGPWLLDHLYMDAEMFVAGRGRTST